MKLRFVLLVCGHAWAWTNTLAAAESEMAPREPHSLVLHGTEIHDDYHWMTNLGDPRLHPWVAAQNAKTDRAFAAIRGSDLSESIRADLDMSLGVQGFLDELLRNAEASSRSVSFGRADLDSTERLSVSSLEENYSFGITNDFGSDMQLWQVTRDDAPETTDFLLLKFASILSAAGDDIIYVTDRDHRTNGSRAVVGRHKFGTSQLEDQIIFQVPTADSYLQGYRTSQGDYILILTDRHRVVVGKLNVETGEFIESLVKDSDDCALLNFYRDAPLFYCLTETGAQIHRGSGDEGHTQRVYQLPGGTWASASLMTDNRLYLVSQVLGRQGVIVLDLESGTWRSLVEPHFASLSLVKSSDSMVLVRSYADGSSEFVRSRDFSFRDGEVIYRGGSLQTETETVDYTAHNGRRVPIYITKRRGQELNQDTPVFMYGYGGFDVAVRPGQGMPTPTWLEQGGVLATVILPGGSELDREWRDAGRLLNKKNVFDDFARAARTLIALGKTRKEKLAIGGTSNGGLLAAATAHFHSDLFAAVIPSVGVLDFVFFQNHTAGKYWFADYGDNRVLEEFQNQLSLSPLHQTKSGALPATLVVTATHDDRVMPHHSYRYAAKLLQAQIADEPIYLHTVQGGSHNLRVAPRTERQRLNENVLGFLMSELEMK